MIQNKSMYRSLLLIGIFSVFICTPVHTQNPEEPIADILTERLKSDHFSIGFLLQSRGSASFRDNTFLGGHSYDLGSTRIDFRGTVDRNFTYRVRIYFLSQQQSIDARVGYRFNDRAHFIAGAFKPFMSRELDPSPGRIDFVNRARLVGAMMNTLEIGTSLLGEFGNFKYRIGMYNGSGTRAITEKNDNRFLYTARLSWHKQSESNTFELGGNMAINQTRNESVGNTGLTSEKNRLLYGGYFMYRGDFFFSTTEFMQSRFNAIEFNDNRETINGFYSTLGFVLDKRNELLARWDHLSFDLRDNATERIILGWNYYPTSLVSFRVNLITEFGGKLPQQYGAAAIFQFMF